MRWCPPGEREQRAVRERHADPAAAGRTCRSMWHCSPGAIETTPRPTSPIVSSSASSSARSAKRLGTGLPSTPRCGGREAGGEPGGARVHRLAQHVAASRAISSAVAVRSYAASPITNRRSAVWPMYAAKLMPTPWSRDRREVLGERREVPRDARARASSTFMSSTFSSVRAMSVVVLGPGRRDREAAVAGDDRGDAVEARRRERGVPEHLRVVVRVDVDEAGRDDAAAGVEHALAVEVRRRSR